MNASDGALIAAFVAAILFVIGAFVLYEAYLLYANKPPITTYTRNLIRQYPGFAFSLAGILIFALGNLLAHFFWDAGCN